MMQFRPLLALLLSLNRATSFTLPKSGQLNRNPILGGNQLSKGSNQPLPRVSALNMMPLESASSIISDTSMSLSSISLNITPDEAEALAGPFFGLSLFPYLAFLYFLDVPENGTPKGVTVGFATCLLFVFLTIPAAIAAKVLYGVSLADSDWLHGSAESLLTITNLVTVVAFRQALAAKERSISATDGGNGPMPLSATSYDPMVKLVTGLTALAALTAFVPAIMGPEVHTPYLGGFMDLPKDIVTFGHPEPDNALTITW